jgi:stage II sporulation protein D
VTAINIVDLEAYLLGVVPLEIGGGRPAAELEAVKAQAVAARTYAVRHLGSRQTLGFDFYATVADQVYGGLSKEDPTASRAVRETAGEIVTYQGAPILAYYHSTCGGHTAAIEEVWQRAPVPYLKSVSDEVSGAKGRYYCESSNRFRWDVSWSGTELRETLARTLAARGGGSAAARIGRVERVEVRGWSRSRRAESLVVNTDAGRFEVPGDSIRWVLEAQPGRPLNSTLFVLDADAGSGEVRALRAQGGGWGHGIGMCQVGALGRARAGQSYRQILTTYYQQTQITRLY